MKNLVSTHLNFINSKLLFIIQAKMLIIIMNVI